MPVVKATSLVCGKVERINVCIGEIEEVEACGRLVKVSIREEVINDVGSNCPFELTLFFSFLCDGGLGLSLLISCHTCGDELSLCLVIRRKSVLVEVRHDVGGGFCWL